MPIPSNELLGLRIRVERLLRGDKRPDDLTAIFLALLDYSGGRECVVEIGHYIAHRGERKIGITTREAKDFFRTIRFYTDYTYRNRPINLLDLPKNFPDLIAGSFRRTSNELISRHLHTKRAAAERQLSEIKTRLTTDSQGRVILAWPTDADRALISLLLGHITVRPAFTDRQLIDQLTATLIANGILEKAALKQFRKLKEFVGLFAVANMHMCTIDLGDGTTAALQAGATKSEGLIQVNAVAEIKNINSTGIVRVASAFFKTDIDVFEYADEALHPESDQTPTWPLHVEVTPLGRLVSMA